MKFSYTCFGNFWRLFFNHYYYRKKLNKSSFQCYWCIQKSLGPSSAITMKCDAMKKENVLLTTPEKARPNDLRHPRILINKNVRHKIQKKMHWTASSQTFLKWQFAMQTLRPRYSWNAELSRKLEQIFWGDKYTKYTLMMILFHL